MPTRIVLIHWNEDEAAELAEPLIKSGWQVEIEAEDGARISKRVLDSPPEAVVIYLSRLPSHGRETARYLLSQTTVPVIFVDGAKEKVENVRAVVPDATFIRSDGLAATLAGLR